MRSTCRGARDTARPTNTAERAASYGMHRIVNDPCELAVVIGQCGESPQVVIETTYGWYWAVDLLQELGAVVHLANPRALNRGRVKNDVHDATDLADMLRLNRLAEAWIAPPALRELRELVRYRAKLVQLRSGLQSPSPCGDGQRRRATRGQRLVRAGRRPAARSPRTWCIPSKWHRSAHITTRLSRC